MHKSGKVRMTNSHKLCLAASLALLLIIALTPMAAPAQAQAPADAGKVVIYLFWGDGCPHCATEKTFLAALAEEYDGVLVRDFEVWQHPEYQEPLFRMAARFGFEPTAVPITFIGDRYWIGFVEEPIGREMEETVEACLANGCPDAGAGIFDVPAAAITPEATATLTAAEECEESGGQYFPQAEGEACLPPAEQTAPPAAVDTAPPIAAQTLTIPLLGQVDLGTQSLVLSTALIAFVDGFNPCSLWVLSVLLALTLHTGSRKKVFIIGLVFITVTSFVYVLFIAGLFTMFRIVSFVGWIQVVVALLALFFAAVNIKDYFWYKEGLSFTISDDKKPGLYKRMRRVLNAGDSLPALIGATVVMSAGASLVEFSCTAGFPVLWSNLVAAQGVTALTFIGLLAIYMLVYQLDELAIFLTAVFSMRATRLEEKQGRILKLMGGMLMLTLAIVMLVDPTVMNRLDAALGVFAVAFGATLLVLLVHRVILPRLGIHVGSEFAKR
jgi:thiol-disulfide isomerase/thioredoxin